VFHDLFVLSHKYDYPPKVGEYVQEHPKSFTPLKDVLDWSRYKLRRDMEAAEQRNHPAKGGSRG
jgi:hypothetical protein